MNQALYAHINNKTKIKKKKRAKSNFLENGKKKGGLNFSVCLFMSWGEEWRYGKEPCDLPLFY
jgi:hypothetical protein